MPGEKNVFSQRCRTATSIAGVVHFFGALGIVWGDRSLFVQATAFNLILGFILLLWTSMPIDRKGWICTGLAFLVGMGAEWIGVHRGWLFGHYAYGSVLGPRMDGVPWVIGLNWCVLVWCAFSWRTAVRSKGMPGWLAAVVSALLLVAFDFLLEPVAIKLGFWSWEGGGVPWTNYLSWFGISLALQLLFHAVFKERRNQFAIHLLIIQGAFFITLDCFL